MGKTKKPLLSLDAHGTLGDIITYQKRGRGSIVRKKPIPADPKSLAQLSWRHMYQKAVALWHALSGAEKQEWETLARPKHMTGFAWFMSQCLRPNPGIYLPLQGGTMSGAIDMASNRVLHLPEPVDGQEPLRLTDSPVVHGAAKHTDITRELFIPAFEGFCLYGSESADYSPYSSLKGSANLDEPQVIFTTKVPDDFVSFTSLKAVWVSPAAAGGMVWEFWAAYASAGQHYHQHVDIEEANITDTAGANIINAHEPLNPLNLPDLALGDYLGISFNRYGSMVEDTLDDAVYLLGLLFTYVANQ